MREGWFEALFGFVERGYHDTRERFTVVGDELVSATRRAT